jgi:hypothetical protein
MVLLSIKFLAEDDVLIVVPNCEAKLNEIRLTLLPLAPTTIVADNKYVAVVEVGVRVIGL